MMEYPFLALAIVVLVLLISVARRLPWFSPLVINTLVWLIVFVVGVFVGDHYYPIQDQVFVSWLIFFLGSTGVYLLSCTVKRSILAAPTPPRYIPFNYSLLLCITIIWLAVRVWVVGSSGPEHFFLNLRLSSNGIEEFEPLGFVGRLYPLVFALFLFEHVYSTKGNRHLRILLWSWILLYAFATMGKFGILTPVLAWIVIQGFLGRIKFTFLALFLSTTVILMFVLHYIRAAESDDSTLLNLIGIYIYSPIVALGYMPLDTTMPFGFYSLRFFYALGYSLDIADKPVEVILTYVEIPALTNVYTAMQPFFIDFGLIGVGIFALLFSGFFSFLYWLARNNNSIGLMLYAGFAIILVGQFIGDFLATMLSGNIQLALCILFVYWFSREMKNVS